MKRLCLIIAMLIWSVPTFGQEYTIYRAPYGRLKYEIPERGEWIDKNEWIELYGRKQFKLLFGDRWSDEFDHFEEEDYVRWNISTALQIKKNNCTWQRVFPLECDIDKAIEIATATLQDAVIKDNVVEGHISDVEFIDRLPHLIFSMQNNIWQADVRYEFKDGRYRVTLTNIRSKLKMKIGTGYRSSLIGVGVSVQDENYYETIYNLLYNDGSRISAYDTFINSIDYTFCELFMLKNKEHTVFNDNW